MLELYSSPHLKLHEVTLSISAFFTPMYILRWQTRVDSIILFRCNLLPYLHVPIITALCLPRATLRPSFSAGLTKSLPSFQLLGSQTTNVPGNDRVLPAKACLTPAQQ